MLAAAEAAAMMAAAEAAARDAEDASNNAVIPNDFPQSVMYNIDGGDEQYHQQQLDSNSINGEHYSSFGPSSLSVTSMDRSMDGAQLMGGGVGETYMGAGLDSYAELANQSLDQSYNDMEATAINSMLQQMAAEQQLVQQQQEQDFNNSSSIQQQQQQQQEEQNVQGQHEEYLNFQNQFSSSSSNASVPKEDDAMASDALGAWPEEHFLTVANNGMVIGATETVTGFPAESLLMTSIFDNVHAQDLVGLQAICCRFWEKGQPDIEAYFRRRTIEDDWMWLAAKVITYIEDPVPGLILYERRVLDGKLADSISRTTRIPAMLANAVDEAFSKVESSQTKTDADSKIVNKEVGELLMTAIPGLADDAVALQAFLSNATENPDSFGPDGVNQLQTLLDAAATGGTLAAKNIGSAVDNNARNKDQSSSSALFSVMKKLRSGACLDLSKVSLIQAEIKLISLVLSGRLQMEDVGTLVFSALSAGNNLDAALEGISTASERQLAQIEVAQAANREKIRHVRRNREGASSHHHSRNHYKRLGDITRSSSFESLTKNGEQVPPEHKHNQAYSIPSTLEPSNPPPIAVLNLSHTNIGNQGLDMLCEVLDNPFIKTLDLGFCFIEERGILSLCRALSKRKKSSLPNIQGLILSGNFISYKAAKELGLALSNNVEKKQQKRTFRKRPTKSRGGYDEDDEADDDDDFDDDEDDVLFSSSSSRSKSRSFNKALTKTPSKRLDPENGLLLLQLACSSLSPEALLQLMIGLGQDCPIRELNISANKIGSAGASNLVSFLEGKGIHKFKKNQAVMPYLDRLDLSNNNLGNDGTAMLTRAVAKRVKVNLIDLRLTYNNIGASGIETIMNKLLQHNLECLHLDNNLIGDRGCQLIASSLPSMSHLSRLTLSFNQIGSRGVTALMRSLLGCESITFLGLSGNVMKIGGAIAMGFALAQHPRLAELELDNCCLSQVAQCHIAAGVISNRWVPMRTLNGFKAGPPMVAIGALDLNAQSLGNEECFRLRRDIQMKTILQWMQKRPGDQNVGAADAEVADPPSQSAYMRMLDWLSKVPFDEDELNDLRKYFYDIEGDGNGMRGSDGLIDLKLRGDLLAALGSDVISEIHDNSPIIDSESQANNHIGMAFEDSDAEEDTFEFWNTSKLIGSGSKRGRNAVMQNKEEEHLNMDVNEDLGGVRKKVFEGSTPPHIHGDTESAGLRNSNKSLSLSSATSNLSRSGSERSSISMQESKHGNARAKPRIAMFPAFASKLETVRAQAQEYMDGEEDPAQQDIIAQLFAEASLTLLRQLKYHCMNSGLDGWRQGKIRRKILVIDDSNVTRKMVARAFEKANFIVDTAENGREGVAKLKQSVYDIAFMDIDMPVMNGFDATKELREWEDAKRPGARQPICALTAAYVDDFERSELMKFKEAGLDVMESKPCNIPRLFKVVDDVSPMFSDLSISVSANACDPGISS